MIDHQQRERLSRMGRWMIFVVASRSQRRSRRRSWRTMSVPVLLPAVRLADPVDRCNRVHLSNSIPPRVSAAALIAYVTSQNHVLDLYSSRILPSKRRLRVSTRIKHADQLLGHTECEVSQPAAIPVGRDCRTRNAGFLGDHPSDDFSGVLSLQRYAEQPISSVAR